MTGNPDLKVGAISWIDLAIDDAEAIQDSYCQVVGWRSMPSLANKDQDFIH